MSPQFNDHSCYIFHYWIVFDCIALVMWVANGFFTGYTILAYFVSQHNTFFAILTYIEKYVVSVMQVCPLISSMTHEVRYTLCKGGRLRLSLQEPWDLLDGTWCKCSTAQLFGKCIVAST